MNEGIDSNDAPKSSHVVANMIFLSIKSKMMTNEYVDETVIQGDTWMIQ